METTGTARAAAAMFAADTASRRLGIELLRVVPGEADARMRVTESMLNGHGSAHGGLVFTLADTAFSCACNSRGYVTVAAKADIVFVAPVEVDDVLVAEARERVRYGRHGIYDVTVVRVGDDGTREVVAEFRGHSHTTRTPLPPTSPGTSTG